MVDREGVRERNHSKLWVIRAVYITTNTLKTVVGGTMYTKWVNTHSLTKYEGLSELCEFVVKQYICTVYTWC